MNKKRQFCVCLLTLASQQALANNHILWIGHGQNELDYFEDGSSTLKPDGQNIGYGYSLNDEWQFSLSYGESEGDGRWPTPNTDLNNLFNLAETESKFYAISASWIQTDYSVSVAYSETENNERALTRLPLILEIVSGEDKAFAINYDRFYADEAWTYGFSLGLQYADSDNRTVQTFFTDPVTIAGSQFDETSWSTFIDLDIAYWFEQESFSWAPQLTLSRNWEISSDGDPLIVLTRGDERRVFTQFNDRFENSFRTPDAGFWELSLQFDWLNDWSTSIAYGKTVSTEVDVTSLSFDVSVAF